jgi:DNA-3-methyladenine glycosylase I
MMAKLQRCAWAESDPLLRTYHDEEWGVPQDDSRMLWEMLMLEGFQAGLSWLIILRKRESFRKAFRNFDPKTVAGFKEKDIERLMADPGIIRARAKIDATIGGAKIFCEMKDRGESFSDFCWSFTDGKVLKGDGRTAIATSPLSEQISKEMKRRGFKFVGPTIVYAWMQAVGIVNDHSVCCFRRGLCEKAVVTRPSGVEEVLCQFTDYADNSLALSNGHRSAGRGWLLYVSAQPGSRGGTATRLDRRADQAAVAQARLFLRAGCSEEDLDADRVTGRPALFS